MLVIISDYPVSMGLDHTYQYHFFNLSCACIIHDRTHLGLVRDTLARQEIGCLITREWKMAALTDNED